MQLTGEELLARYLSEHPGDNDGVDEVGETIIRSDTCLRWMKWMLDGGYISQERYRAAVTLMFEGEIPAFKKIN
jgi:hypothetical protein